MFNKLKLRKMSDEELLAAFLLAAVQLQPVEFAGILKILCVASTYETEDGQKKTRPLEDLINDLSDHFLRLRRKSKREVIELIQAANAAKPIVPPTPIEEVKEDGN